MPIEIRELTIKVNVNQDQNKASAPAAPAGGSGEEDEKHALIQEAAEEILRILENSKER